MSFYESQCEEFDPIHTLLTLNESSSSENKSDGFFQASLNNMMEFENMQNNAENDKVVVQRIFQLVKWMM